MTWLEQNIDAYRIVSEILGDLRAAIRQGLEAVYGETWYRDGLPEEVFERLIGAKEREKAIDWYEGQYQQIMDYAVFADLVEIIDHNAEHFSALRELAPNNALLQARFIELDVMRSKLGRARPISETELSFLGTFHLRFRKAINQMPAPEPAEAGASPDAADAEIEVTTPAPAIEESEPATEPEPAANPDDESDVEEPPAPPPRPTESRNIAEKTAKPVGKPTRTTNREPASEEAPAAPPKRAVQSTAPRDDANDTKGPDPPAQETEEADEPESPPKPADPLAGHEHVGPKKLAAALENNDHRTVLRELYREVTAIAEGVWTSDVTPAPLVWEQVTASSWYEENFSRLGLHALSVFYEVTGNVESMARGGATKEELQGFLKETNFAKTLLALRDMFQSNNI